MQTGHRQREEVEADTLRVRPELRDHLNRLWPSDIGGS